MNLEQALEYIKALTLVNTYFGALQNLPTNNHYICYLAHLSHYPCPLGKRGGLMTENMLINGTSLWKLETGSFRLLKESPLIHRIKMAVF